MALLIITSIIVIALWIFLLRIDLELITICGLLTILAVCLVAIISIHVNENLAVHTKEKTDIHTIEPISDDNNYQLNGDEFIYKHDGKIYRVTQSKFVITNGSDNPRVEYWDNVTTYQDSAWAVVTFKPERRPFVLIFVE